MKEADLPVRSISDAAARIAAGRLTSSALLEASLDRIAKQDEAVRAWASIDEAGARAAARERDEEGRAGRARGPLHGIPVAIKDIFHVARLPPFTCARRRTRWPWRACERRAR